MGAVQTACEKQPHGIVVDVRRCNKRVQICAITAPMRSVSIVAQVRIKADTRCWKGCRMTMLSKLIIIKGKECEFVVRSKESVTICHWAYEVQYGELLSHFNIYSIS